MVIKHTWLLCETKMQVSLSAGEHLVIPSQTEKLLGCQISEDLKWKQHLLLSDESVIRQLTSRVNGLCLISDKSTFETRLMVANGIILSKLSYLIQLWGGCDDYLLSALQIQQNRAARVVAGLSWFTPITVLLRKCKWLSVRQLVLYQSIILAHKIATTGSPASLADKLSTFHPYTTRRAVLQLTRPCSQQLLLQSNKRLQQHPSQHKNHKLQSQAEEMDCREHFNHLKKCLDNNNKKY